MKISGQQSARILIVCAPLCLVFCTEARAADLCDASVLPKKIQVTLQNTYPDWQPERLEQLYSDNRKFWTERHADECPGIAIGHFESKTELSYALLLVSKPDRKRDGLRILVFSRISGTAEYAARVISKYDTGSFYESSDHVIFAVPAGHYQEAVGPKKITTDLDGIWYEIMEKGAILYYWENGRYRELVTSD